MSDFTERILPSDPASSKQQSTERIIAKSLIVSRYSTKTSHSLSADFSTDREGSIRGDPGVASDQG
jgi:hypothetical protein